MKRDFLYVDEITSISPDKVCGGYNSSESNDWEYIESAAQICSLHVRWLIKCERHSFLLKINSFEVENQLGGVISIESELIGHSSESYKYRVTGKSNGTIVFKGDLVIGTVDYSKDFNKEDITKHYKGVLECLIKDMTWN